MREIKFRGKSTTSGQWIIGSLLLINEQSLIVPSPLPFYDENYDEDDEDQNVVPETVGQYTGLKDKNGVEVFEGDVIQKKGWLDGSLIKGVVYFNDMGQWMAREITDYHTPESDYLFDIIRNGGEVIGNIHDNPDLLN